MDNYLDWLGYEAKDCVTGFSGVVDSICFDLYGCVQAAVTPKHDPKDKERKLGAWFDVKRLRKVGKNPVMPQPLYSRPGREIGAADKPSRAANTPSR